MLIYVPIDKILDNPYQRRSDYSDIEDLAERIAAARRSYPDSYGIMQVGRGRLIFKNARYPDGHLVTDDLSKYGDDNGVLVDDRAFFVELAFSHRRFRAFRHLVDSGQYTDVKGYPVHVAPLSDQQMLDAVWSENAERKNISAVEEAELLSIKLQVEGTQTAVAASWGLGRSTIANRLRLLQLPEDIQQDNKDGLLSERQCLALFPVLQLRDAFEELGQEWEWENSWYPISPADFLEGELSPETTSKEIREYAEKAWNVAGNSVPGTVAKADLSDAPGVLPDQASGCRGCRFRWKDKCVHTLCLKAKEHHYARKLVEEAAEELGLPVAGQHVKTILNWSEAEDVARIYTAGGCDHLCIGFQPDRVAMRPFKKDNDTSWADSPFVEGDRTGIVIVHDGPLSPSCQQLVAQGKALQAGDDDKGGGKVCPHLALLPPAEKIKEWSKAEKQKRLDIVQLAYASIKEALHGLDETALDALWALASLKTSGPNKLITLVRWIADRGNQLPNQNQGYNSLQMARRVNEVLSRAGITKRATHTAEETAVCCLVDWYDNYRERTWYLSEGGVELVEKILSLPDHGIDFFLSAYLDTTRQDVKWWLQTHFPDRAQDILYPNLANAVATVPAEAEAVPA